MVTEKPAAKKKSVVKKVVTAAPTVDDKPKSKKAGMEALKMLDAELKKRQQQKAEAAAKEVEDIPDEDDEEGADDDADSDSEQNEGQSADDVGDPEKWEDSDEEGQDQEQEQDHAQCPSRSPIATWPETATTGPDHARSGGTRGVCRRQPRAPAPGGPPAWPGGRTTRRATHRTRGRSRHAGAGPGTPCAEPATSTRHR